VTPSLSIVIVSYNTREIALACVRSVFEQTTRTPFELLVIDNASADGSADAVEAEFEGRLRLMRSADNLGFARANNEAAKDARGELLLLLNPDTVVLDAAIEKLLAFAEAHPDAGIWGGRTLFPDRSLNPTSCWNRMTPWSVFCQATGLSKAFPRVPLLNPEAVAAWWTGGPRRVDIVSGCFFLIRRDLWDRLGGFDPSFFMYGEEADLCLRARALGARPMVTPDAVIIHLGGASERVRADKLVRLLKAKAMLVRRHVGGPAWLSVGLLALWSWSRAFAWAIEARVSPSPARRAAASAWTETWRRRREWLSPR